MVEKINIEGKNHPCILLAALDWGLGHTTRCIPIIRYLIKNNCEVVIAAEGKQLSLLQLEFPHLQFVHLKGYRLQYSNNRWKTIVKIIAQIPQIFVAALFEHRWLMRFARQKRIDGVISDNRYGFYLRNVPSVIITHQLNIKTPFGRPGNKMVNLLNYRAIRPFDSCWVPDLAGVNNFGGDLSHPPSSPPFSISYIGLLSRFRQFVSRPDPELVAVLISGPEPQRSIFEALILTQASSVSKQFIIVRGLPGLSNQLEVSDNVTVYNHLPTPDLEQLIARAALVISRSGYSTVMEMMSLGKRCLFVPTPGQSEQEYLAEYLSGKHYCIAARQDNFSIVEMINRSEKMEWKMPVPGQNLLDTVLDNFIASLERKI